MPCLLDFICMCRNIAPNDVSLVRLKVPWSNQNQITISYPHSSLYLASNSTCPYLAIGTFYNDVISTDQLYDLSKQLTLAGHNHLLKCSFVENFSFA